MNVYSIVFSGILPRKCLCAAADVTTAMTIGVVAINKIDTTKTYSISDITGISILGLLYTSTS